MENWGLHWCPLNCTLPISPDNITSIGGEGDKPDWMKTFLDGSRFWVQGVVIPIVVLIGVIGNGVTVVVLTRRRMRSSTNTYLTALALSDLLYLLFVCVMSVEHYPNLHHKQYYLYWVCRPYVNWLLDAMTSTSIWLIVTFTVERYIAVCHPLHGKMLCTESRARIAIVLIYMFWILATATTPFEWELHCDCGRDGEPKFNLAVSEFGNNELYKTLFYRIWSFTSVYLPLILLSIFNTLLILAVHRSTKTRRQMTQRDNVNNSQKTENKITITLIAVVILFVICQTPATAVLIYKSLYTSSKEGETFLRVLGNFANLLVVINAATNFLLYTAMSAKYRRTLVALFWRCSMTRSPAHSSINTAEFSRSGRGTSTAMTTVRDRDSRYITSPKSSNPQRYDSSAENQL